jgi:filamentous hemagglutinin family protein
MLLAVIGAAEVVPEVVWAQSITPSIVPAGDGINTSVRTENPGVLTIQGGTQTGTNLFHSFQQFGLKAGETANFQATPTVQNILSRVVGGDASVINGLLQVTGGKANLFLMNPVGIVFGANAQLNLPAAFTATTANAIGFERGWWNAVGRNDLTQLLGNPNQFAFTTVQAGAIVNAANLTLNPTQDLTLLGGTVLSTGAVTAGNLNLTAVSGNQLVRITSPGYLLGVELPADVRSRLNPAIFDPSRLAALITGGEVVDATRIVVSADGKVRLMGVDREVSTGDVVAQKVTGQTVNLNADRHVSLINSELRSMRDLNIQANDTVMIRDSVSQPVSLLAGGDLTIRGDKGVDILALNHPGAAIQSGGNLNLMSDGDISGDAHFASGGAFSMRNTTGGLGKFVSLDDPVISADGDVVFGDYTGVSLKVEAKGSITAGNITITGPDTTFRVLEDWDTSGRYEIVDRKTATSPTIIPTAVRIWTTDSSHSASLKTRIPFSAQAGQTIGFDWDFSTEESSPTNAEKDVAKVTLTRQGGLPQEFQLASYDDATVTGFPRSTGLRTFSTNIPTAGNYILEIAVQEKGSNPGNSELLVKNITPLPLQISDTSLLAAHPAVILKAGLSSLENPPNLPQLNVPTIPTNFTGSGTITSKADITVSGINAIIGSASDGYGGSVMLNATGKVTAAIGGTLRAGAVEILAGGEIRAGQIRTTKSYSPQNHYQPDGSVVLKNTDGKIIVDYIRNLQGGDITIDAYDGFQARQTTLVRSVTDSKLGPSPASIVTGGKISIQHGGQNLQVGLGVERDATGTIIYRASGGPRAGERVFIKSGGGLAFVYSDNTDAGSAVIQAVPFDPNAVSADTNYTAGAIFIGEGFNETLYGAFQDQNLSGSSNITIASVPRPPKPDPGPGSTGGTPGIGTPGTGSVASNGETSTSVNAQAILTANAQTNAMNKPTNQCPAGTVASSATTIASRSGSTTGKSAASPCVSAQAKGATGQDALLKIDPALLKP